MLDKSKTNFLIDALMFLCMMAIAGLGFLMKFVLISGKDRAAKYDRNVDLYLLGMDRHEWGTIHLIIGFILLAALALHIFLHWKLILGIYEKLVGSRRARRIIATVFVVVCAFLILFSFAVKPEIQELGRGRGKDKGTEHIHGGSAETYHETGSSIEIRGYMTLAEVARKYDVPVDSLKEHLGLPESTSGQERLGRLRQKYGFTMHDVEKVIEQHLKAP